MKPKLFRIFGLIISFIMIWSFSSCYDNHAYYPDEELVVAGGIDGADYTYSNKVSVVVYVSDVKRLDLTLKCYKSDDEWLGGGYSVFERLRYKQFAWNNFFLFIRTVDDEYYELDIKGYCPGEFEDDNEEIPKYSLKKYREKEFKDKYPDYEIYEWLDG